MRFVRSLLLAALAICEFKLEAINVSDRQAEHDSRCTGHYSKRKNSVG